MMPYRQVVPVHQFGVSGDLQSKLEGCLVDAAQHHLPQRGSVPVVWGAVLVMALAAMADPLRIGITVLVISRPRPVFQLLAFWLGGVVMGLAVGLSVVFFLRDVALDFFGDLESTTATSTVALVQIAVGVLALLMAALIAARFPARLRARAPVPEDAPAATLQTAAPNAFSRLSTRAGDAVQGGSLWVAFVAGAWLATPLQYVAALAAILASGASAGTQVVAVVGYHVVALAFAEIPLLTYLVKPDRTQAVIMQVHDWVQPRRRQLIAAIIAVVGILLVVNGIGSL